jgi:hypothetical protein
MTNITVKPAITVFANNKNFLCKNVSSNIIWNFMKKKKFYKKILNVIFAGTKYMGELIGATYVILTGVNYAI